MNRLSRRNNFENTISPIIENFFTAFNIASLLRAANACKERGFPVVAIFQSLFELVFSNRTMFMAQKTIENMKIGKDAFYRFVNSTSTNWLRFTSKLASKVISTFFEKIAEAGRINVIIIDDTIHERSRSKSVELLAKVFDHAKHCYTYGFRLLTLGWSDGNTFVPVNYCLLSSENPKARSQAQKDIDKRTFGHKIRRLAQTKAPAVVLELIDMAIESGIKASHVLFDSWFCSPASLIAVKEKGFDVISIAKKSSKQHYIYEGQRLPVTKIWKGHQKRRGRSRYLLSVEVCVESDGKIIPARLVYVRNRNKRKEYLVLISTDMNLSEDQIIRLYGKRWGIEVFFKFCKSYLKLGKESRTMCYDAMNAYVAIVFARYIMLSIENRLTRDESSFGELFYRTCDGLRDITFEEAIRLLMSVLLSDSECGFLMGEEMNEMLEEFVLAVKKFLPQILQKRT